MSDLDRLHDIVDALPPQQVHALLTLLAPARPTGDDEFARRLAQAGEEEVDEETVSRILAAEAEQGENLSRRIEAAAESVKRLLVHRPAAQRELHRMDRSEAERIVRWRVCKH
jgi:hypothetical protein